MRFRWILGAVAAGMVFGVSGAVATHAPQIDPATVPAGLLASHNHVSSIRINPLARAVKKHRADVFVQHIHVDAGGALPWHTHPGPAIVTVVSGFLGYQRAQKHRCVTTWYGAGTGVPVPLRPFLVEDLHAVQTPFTWQALPVTGSICAGRFSMAKRPRLRRFGDEAL
jgi:hypothetical protein